MNSRRGVEQKAKEEEGIRHWEVEFKSYIGRERKDKSGIFFSVLRNFLAKGYCEGKGIHLSKDCP